MSGRSQLCRPHYRGVMALLIIAACADPSAPRVLVDKPSTEITDAAHNGGNSRFYFLPPLVPAPSTSGTADGTLAPEVSVCEWSGASCESEIAHFTVTAGTGSAVVGYNAGQQEYNVNWKTDQCSWGPCDLDETRIYRLIVRVGSRELGHYDLRVFATASQAKNAQTNEFIALVEGRTLPIKFRIEHGIVGGLSISPNPASVDIGSTASLTATVTDLHGVTIPGSQIAWASGNASTVTVSSTGVITGIASGCTTISATLEGLQATVPVAVTPLEPDMVFMDRRLVPGQSYLGLPLVYSGRVDGCIPSIPLSEETPLDNGSSPPVIAPDGHSVAFIAGSDNAHSLRIVDLDGTNERVLFTPGLRPFSPTWSPDGTRLAFGAWVSVDGGFSSDVYVINANGSSLQALTGPPAPSSSVNNVRWSPVSEQIAFTRLPGSGTQLHIVSSAGGPVLNVTAGITGPQRFEWSPDGSRIAYTTGPDFAVRTVNPDGTNRTLVRSGDGYERAAMAWSPDGSKLAFGAGPCPGAGVETIDASTGASTQLVCANVGQVYVEWSSGTVTWSRDGSEVLYGRWRGLINGTAVFNVEAARVDGTATRVVTTGRVPVVRR
jgi:Tol biopolymer transport system component